MIPRPIIFSAPTVRAILEGRKTQTRRVARVFETAPGYVSPIGCNVPRSPKEHEIYCPYGVAGDRLWVKEAWGVADGSGRLIDPCLNFRAGGQLPLIGHADPPTWSIAGGKFEVNDAGLLAVPDGWRSPRFMPRWASRITLEITDVRVEQVQDISANDALREGIDLEFVPGLDVSIDGDLWLPGEIKAKAAFWQLWDSINAKRGFGWDVNPWVWALTFKRVDSEVTR